MADRNLHYSGNVDRDPEETQRRVLAFLASQRWGVGRRVIQNAVWGCDTFGAAQTATALRVLRERKLIDTSYKTDGTGSNRHYVVTDAGRAALALVDELDRGEAS